ncbi:MAG TPA: cupin domain-containing protein [Baekduia sp.]|uniref:cupin domain-containing protein n=1 Tax=Baekduia sp. TaxID=2600305 RepID=UPI002CCD3F4B|nr:cupin domain-containing protein [Baekduia sp.]HMJ34118.1 cupin domain-containing protein [Baekduia sp.]
MSHTIKNLRESTDMAPKFGFDAVQEARFCWRDLDAEQTGLSLMRVKPGQRSAFAHRHDQAEEIYVILSGTGRIKLDDEIADVGPLDAIRIAPGVARALEAGDSGLEYLAFGPHHESDGEILKEDFWS